MTLLVDTSVWSLAYRRDTPSNVPEVMALRSALSDGDAVATTGIILLELLRGFIPARAQKTITAQFASLDFVEPNRADYIAAAGLANTLRSAGVQIGSVDALIAQLAVSRDLTLLTTDRDFGYAAPHIPLRLWVPSG